VVRDPAVWSRVLVDVTDAAKASGLGLGGIMASPLPGPAGNVEFLLVGVLGADGVQSGPAIATAVDEGARLAGSATR
jgi:23S rRNA (cytidine1920-2'-O)/16S rRNA (cytidine1409-2'-O)-methyltransferase